MKPSFDPNGPGIPGSFFGLPYSLKEASLVIISVPWDVTVSYHEGTSKGPEAIKEASLQVDLFLNDIHEAWTSGIHGPEIPGSIIESNSENRELARSYLQRLKSRDNDQNEPELFLSKINKATEELTVWVQKESSGYLNDGKKVCILGGDHSTPLGLMQALGENETFGILQIDAHADLRKAYEGFLHSHASIMYNALQIEGVKQLVQVGIRDLCQEEADLIHSDPRIHTFFYQQLLEKMDTGRTWQGLCTEIIDHLPEKVYISFDIDGLDPSLCPNTGTPVPGGLQFFQAVYLIKHLVHSGRKIIGFDLCEVCPGKDNDWDANVGARILYYLASWMGVSQGWLAEK
jgi:agmatinase